jgi:hypothetical protein
MGLTPVSTIVFIIAILVKFLGGMRGIYVSYFGKMWVCVCLREVSEMPLLSFWGLSEISTYV